MSETAASFTIDVEITPDDFGDLVKFIHKNYIMPQRKLFKNVKLAVVKGEHTLSFRLLDVKKEQYIDAEIRIAKPIQVKIVTSDAATTSGLQSQFKDDLVIVVEFFEEQVRKRTVYFAWVEGKDVIPERIQHKRSNIIYRLFTESMLFFFVIFIAASILLFIIVGLYAPIILVIAQLVLVLLADKIVLRTAEWRITEKDPNVHFLEYHLSAEEHKDFRRKLGEDALMKVKKEIYEKTFAVGKALNLETCKEVFSKFGLECKPQEMTTKIVNVYEIVKEASEKFKFSIPKIAVANTMLPNAAATGLSAKHGVIVINTGLLVQLEKNEIVSVVGHEFSHLKGRDTLSLFGLTATEFLLRIYVFWPLLVSFSDYSLFLLYLYLFAALSIVYFIAKFFESKADLEAAAKVGEPKALAEALRKIGFHRLQFERVPSYRFQEWLQWDPHPPIYFRIARLEKLQTPEQVKHPLIQSIKDNIRGFWEALT